LYTALKTPRSPAETFLLTRNWMKLIQWSANGGTEQGWDFQTLLIDA
jgi:hypothetical protein